MRAPAPGIYRHHKGQRYRLLEVALHTETREPMAVYRALYGDGGLFVRPLAMFLERVDVNGVETPRFALEQATSVAPSDDHLG